MNFGGRLSHEFAIFGKFFCINLLNEVNFSQRSEFGVSLDSSIVYAGGACCPAIFCLLYGKKRKANCGNDQQVSP